MTHTFEVPGAVLRYDVRESEPAGGPVLVMIGSPMGAAGFATLATHFTDRTVVTYDPRGVERSERTDPDLEVTPEVHAADVRAVIEAVGDGPVDLFATSGGAVNALALVAEHPDLVGTLVAHEPPLASCCPMRRTRSPPARPCRTPTISTAAATGWRTSSRWSRCGVRCRTTSPRSRRPIRRCSACPPRTTAPATT